MGKGTETVWKTPVDMHLSKAVFLLDPDILQLHLFKGGDHCSVVRPFVLSTNHVRRCKKGRSLQRHNSKENTKAPACVGPIWSLRCILNNHNFDIDIKIFCYCMVLCCSKNMSIFQTTSRRCSHKCTARCYPTWENMSIFQTHEIA